MWLWQLPVFTYHKTAEHSYPRTIPRWFPTPPASRSFLSKRMQRSFLLKKSWDAYEVGYDYQLELICNPIYLSNMFGHFYGLLRYNSIVLTKLRDPSCIDLSSHTPTTPSPWWARQLMLPLLAGNLSREGCMRNSPPLMPFGLVQGYQLKWVLDRVHAQRLPRYRQAVDCRYTLGF